MKGKKIGGLGSVGHERENVGGLGSVGHSVAIWAQAILAQVLNIWLRFP